MCLYGCPYGYIFSSADVVTQLRSRDGFTYLGGLKAQRLVSRGDGADVTVTRTGQGNAFAEFLLGAPDSATASRQQTRTYSEHYYALFVQDDWKVTPKLTLNLGLRYDVQVPFVERHAHAHEALGHLLDPEAVLVDLRELGVQERFERCGVHARHARLGCLTMR